MSGGVGLIPLYDSCGQLAQPLRGDGQIKTADEIPQINLRHLGQVHGNAAQINHSRQIQVISRRLEGSRKIHGARESLGERRLVKAEGLLQLLFIDRHQGVHIKITAPALGPEGFVGKYIGGWSCQLILDNLALRRPLRHMSGQGSRIADAYVKG